MDALVGIVVTEGQSGSTGATPTAGTVVMAFALAGAPVLLAVLVAGLAAWRRRVARQADEQGGAQG